MRTHLARKFALAAVITVLSVTTTHAQSTTPPPPPTPSSVTGGDPVPTSPDAIQMILVFLHLA